MHRSKLSRQPFYSPFDHLGRQLWMNDGGLEECGLELEHAGNFDLTQTPSVFQAARRHHQTTPLLGSANVHVIVPMPTLSCESDPAQVVDGGQHFGCTP